MPGRGAPSTRVEGWHTTRRSAVRQRVLHGLVPDFRVVRSNILADVKTFSFSHTWYSRARFRGGIKLDASTIKHVGIQKYGFGQAQKEVSWYVLIGSTSGTKSNY